MQAVAEQGQPTEAERWDEEQGRADVLFQVIADLPKQLHQPGVPEVDRENGRQQRGWDLEREHAPTRSSGGHCGRPFWPRGWDPINIHLFNKYVKRFVLSLLSLSTKWRGKVCFNSSERSKRWKQAPLSVLWRGVGGEEKMMYNKTKY